MTFYWLYDLPNWLFCATVVGAFVVFGVIGLLLSRGWVRKLHKVDSSHNDIVSYFAAAVFVLYGITLGLVAVGTWTTFSNVQDKIDAEAQVLASLYRDVGGYGEPLRSDMRQDLKNYTRAVIDVSWPQQQRGIVPTGSAQFIDAFQDHLLSLQPQTMGEQITQAEVFKQFNVLVEYRRARLAATQTGLPEPIWVLVIVGGLISIVVTLFFDTHSLAMHFWMTVLLSALLGLIIFLVATLDNPFRGEVAVSPQPLIMVYDQLMA